MRTKIILYVLGGFVLCLVIEAIAVCCFITYIVSDPDNSGFVYQYDSKEPLPEFKSENPNVIVFDGDIDTLYYDNKIYVVKAEQLLSCISKYDTAVVYCWKPSCTGPGCCSPRAFEECCIERNWTPVIYTSYIDQDQLPEESLLSIPMLFVDPHPFGSSFLSSYEERIIRRLTGTKDMKGRFMRFEKGKFVSYIDHL